MKSNYRSRSGRFASLKRKAYWYSFFALSFMGFGMILAGSMIGSKASASVPEAPITIDNTPAHIEALKADLVSRLLSCESAGHAENDAIVTYDNNSRGSLTGKNVWSFGQLQWKVSTIQHYQKLRDGRDLTQKEAVLLALDTPAASDLAGWVIFETDGGVFNWKNCSDKLGLAEEVTAIKRISK